MKSNYWNYDQLGQHLGLSKNTLYSMVHRKLIPFIRISDRLVRFDPLEIEAWIDGRRTMARKELLSERENKRGGVS